MTKLIRSKNAGPFALTFDIMFDDPDLYRRARDSGVLSKALMARLYNVSEEDVDLYHVDNALAIKISIPRPIASGDLGDSDVYGGQQYAPLVDLEVPD
ncbi:MAG: DUF4387 domain-containing protein [Chloroflexi bacterium]|nr:DUF4387 domain-containing protein [Chloroflexota bacterium]